MSKELEALESIKFGCCDFENRTLYRDEFNIIETALKRLEEIDNKPFVFTCRYDVLKIIKALEIIKEKNVSIIWLKFCTDRAEYNDLANPEEQLTKQEYDLLKEVLL